MMSWLGRAAVLSSLAAALVASPGCESGTKDSTILPDGGSAGTTGAGGSGGGSAGAGGSGGGSAGAGGSGGGSGGAAGGAGSGGAGGGVASACAPGGAFEVRRTSTGYEIEVTDPSAWRCPDAALVCVLQIGGFCFGRHGYAPNGNRVYPLTESEFALLQKGDPVSGYYGNPPSQDLVCAPNPNPNPAACALYGIWQ
jgi:hypothetical protein